MKVLFLCFTPYHIKVSNWLSKNRYNKFERTIILSSFTCIDKDRLYSFVPENLYDSSYYYHLNYKISEVIKKPIKYKRIYMEELFDFLENVDKINPDHIVYFSDNPIPYQKLFNKMKIKGKKLVFVEEGTAIYLNEYKFSVKEKWQFYIRKLLFNDKESRLFYHGRGGYEDIVILREPDLFNSEAEKIRISSEEFKEIILNSIKINFNIEKESSLFCPGYTTYNKSIRNKIYEEIFDYYYKSRKNLYVKLHPAEKEINQIRSLIKEYEPYVKFIDKLNITSEDIIYDSNIKEVISDFSSILINAYYLRKDIYLTSYANMLKKKYGVQINFSCSIFDKLFLEGKIKSFGGY
ncbi:polysialyltransferase family glycosyltransferase [Fonticella tunisiensis]|uniref:Uncharacterized protein n=1 Tax=Fonticella tunisiensis TaxID=1096341 RepID=A0A4R7K4J5_9CLOT|nr:polysialyltransferase family glycosyltransferase [Fonticella tunisiensis]TDT46076.1 hypothetical protein EDD71_1361 [Fonticella tunisiensis]